MPAKMDVAEIERALRAVMESGQVFELRALAVRHGQYAPCTMSGYFDADHIPEAAQAVVRLLGAAKGIYFTPNPCSPSLLARRAYRIERQDKTDSSTSDHEIVRRSWLLVDVDPVRPSGIASTDAEHEAAHELAKRIREWLIAAGWPAPLLLDSGNGAQLMFRIDLFIDDDGLVARCLKALNAVFGTAALHIDTSVFNPARIWRLPGTVNRKGDDTLDRPHRMARLLDAPTSKGVVSQELLERLAATAPVEAQVQKESTKSTTKRASAAIASGLGAAEETIAWLVDWLRNQTPKGYVVRGPEPWRESGAKWTITPCPWNSAHTNASAFIVALPGGQIGAGCQHNSCSDMGWHALRNAWEPSHAQKKGTGCPASEQGNPESRSKDQSVSDDTPGSQRQQEDADQGYPYYTNRSRKIIALNERYFGNLFAQKNLILYEPDEREFYRYVEVRGLWQRVTSQHVETSLAAMLRGWNRDNTFSRDFEKLINQRNLKAIVDAMRGMCEKRGAFAEKPKIIHVANGTLVFDEQGRVVFGLFSPEHYSRNQSPIAYDPHARCDRFVNELVAPAMSADDVLLFQKWMGLALYGYNLPQRFLILDGTPGGGKGTLIRVVHGLIGAENFYQLRTEVLNERFEMYRFIGKTLLYGPDVPGAFLMQPGASHLKAIVGGDPLNPEAKNSNAAFDMFGTFNVVMTCNSRLTVRLDGDVDAWRRRMLIIRYANPPPARRIPDFDKALLKEEGAGILAWALEGFSMLKQDIEACGDFVLSDNQRARVDSLLSESMSLERFLQDQCERKDGCDVTNEELEHAYATYCTDKGWNPLPITLFHYKLPDLMLRLFRASKSQSIKRDAGKAQRGYRRVFLKGLDPADGSFGEASQGRLL